MPSDIVQIVSSLGGDANVLAVYDARVGVTVATGVSQWDDARGASGFAPSLVQGTGSAQPTYSASAATITFDGTADNLRDATNAFWAAITSDCGLVMVGTLPTTGAVNTERMAVLAEAGGTSLLEIRRATNDGVFSVAAGAGSSTQTAALSGTRVFHGARQNSGGGNTRSSARIGGGTEVTGNAAQADQTAGSLVVGANAAVTIFADIVVRAVIVFKGDYRGTAAYANAITEWAFSYHGATP